MTVSPVRGRPFPPGVSGNPSGLSKEIAPLVAEARRLALSHAPKAIEVLAALLGNEDPRVRVAAAEGLLDRAGLRPYSLEPERVEVTATVDVDALRAALAARVEALAAGSDHLLPEKAADEVASNGGTYTPGVRVGVRSGAIRDPGTSPEGVTP